jgi:hypothetical protein
MDTIYKFSVGLYDKDSHVQEVATEEAIRVVSAVCLECGAYGLSLTQGLGIYTHEDGSRVFEPSLFVDVVDITAEQAESMIQGFKRELNQESVMVEARDSDISFK